LNRCATTANGKWEQVPGDPRVIMMHAALLANTSTVLFWGYINTPPGVQPNQTRLWDPVGGYTDPANQPADVSSPPGNAVFCNLPSAGHAYLDDAEGSLLAHGGETAGSPPSNAGNQQALIFRPSTRTWEGPGSIPPVHATTDNRFYATTMTL